jgi:WD40 repeat protein
VAARDACCRPFAYDRIELGINACDYSDDGRWLAAAAVSGVQIWDTASWQPIVHIPMAPATAIRYEASSRSLLVSTETGLFRWPIEWSEKSVVRIGPPDEIELPPDLIPGQIDLSRDRRTSIVELLHPPPGAWSDQAIIIDRSGRRFLQRQPKLRFVSLSPDCRLAAVGNWEGSGASVWDAVTAKKLRQLPTVGNTVVRFTPDGRRLATSTPSEVSFWDVETWQRVRTITKPGIGFGDAISFTRDGRYMAMTATQSMIQLVDVASGKVVASLEADDSPALVKSIALSPTGGQLAMCCYGDGLRVWDLRYIREQLRQQNLDWDDGPLPKTPTPHPGSINVEVDCGDLEPVQRSP